MRRNPSCKASARREARFFVAIEANGSKVFDAQREKFADLKFSDVLREGLFAKIFRMNATDGAEHGDFPGFRRTVRYPVSSRWAQSPGGYSRFNECCDALFRPLLSAA